MHKSLFLVLLMVAISSCPTAGERDVSYDELASLFAKGKNTKLCFWYYDGLRSNKDSEKYHVQYNCAPSENYNGSKIIVKERAAISKSEIVINSAGGKISINEVEKK